MKNVDLANSQNKILFLCHAYQHLSIQEKKKKNEHLWLRLNTELPSVVTCVLSLFSGFNIFFPLCFLKSHTGVKNPKLKTLLHF